MIAQIDRRHTVAELADVARKLEARVEFQLDGAPFDELPAQQLDRYGPCAIAIRMSKCSCLFM